MQGQEIEPDRRVEPVEIPERLGKAMTKDRFLRDAFVALTKGKQREYFDYIASPKREETKLKRLDKKRVMV